MGYKFCSNKDKQLPALCARHRLKRQRKEHRTKCNKHKHVKTLLMSHLIGSQKRFCSHKFPHQVLTCSELKTANMYWNTKAWALTAKMPKIHELPRMGKRTATALAVSLWEKMKTANCGQTIKEMSASTPKGLSIVFWQQGRTLLYYKILLMGKILIIFSSVKRGITEHWYHTG